MTRNGLLVAAVVLILAAIGFNTYVSLHDHDSLQQFVQAESEQRVHTIGERCESQYHQALEHGPQEHWFVKAHGTCLRSLAKVEARAGVTYEASP
jgi:tRNA(Leu) C34 or U34 (ribose-2'-O)-methylase TrmL